MVYEEFGVLIEEEGVVFFGGECFIIVLGSDVDKILSVLNGEFFFVNWKFG